MTERGARTGDRSPIEGMFVQPISYRGRTLAAVTRERFFLADELERRPPEDPLVNFVIGMCVYAHQIANQRLPGPYTDTDARAYARACLIPAELLERPDLPLARAAAALKLPLEELQAAVADRGQPADGANASRRRWRAAWAARRARRCARAWLAGLVVLTAALAVASGPAGALPPTPPGPVRSERALTKLTVAPDGSQAGYARAKFGDGWAQTGDRCDTRERVLARDGTNVRTDTQCHPVSGRWTSAYDGKFITKASGLGIDHIVPLADAWRSGAAHWTATKRKAFANDLTDPQLVAVSAASNRSKDDSGLDERKPPRHAIWCL
jgi:hypothetical protein